MPFNGSGVYTPIGSPDFPAVAATTIRAAQYNNEINDLASALTNCVTRDGQGPATADLPMGGMKHTNVAAAALRTQYARAAEVQDGTLTYLTNVVGANAITAVAPLALAAYSAGQTFRFVAAEVNTGAVTLNINGLGVKAITKQGATALIARDILAGSIVQVTYDGTQFQLQTPTLLQQSAYMSAVAGGTVDAITAAFTPAISALPAAPGTLSVFVRAAGANTSATPTFKADATAAKTIVKGNNVALLEGDIAGVGHWLELQYDATLDKWVLQNPTHGFGGTPPQFDNTARTATTAFVQRALGSYQTLNVVTGSTTLNASHVGSCVLLQSATQFTTTLFSASTVPRGSVIEVINLSSVAQTITGSAANTLVVNGGAATTSITILPGDSLTLIAVGWANLWCVSGTGNLQFSATFGSSLGTAGYQRLPSGLILQWGRLGIGDVPRDYYSSQSFPIAFPNNIFQVNLSLYSFSGDSFDVSAAVTSHSQVGFNFTIQEWSGSVQNLELSYFAIGN